MSQLPRASRDWKQSWWFIGSHALSGPRASLLFGVGRLAGAGRFFLQFAAID